MTFGSWNIPYTNIQYDTIVGTLYYTTSGKLEIDVVKNAFTGGLVQTLKLYKDDSSLMTIEWGDGNVSTTSATGAVTLTNTLAKAGNYTVKVAIADTGIYRLYSGNGGTGIFEQTSASVSTYNYSCTAVRMPQTGIKLTGLGDTALGYCQALKYVSFFGNFTYIGNSFCNRCFNLTGIVLPNTITNLDAKCFYGIGARIISNPTIYNSNFFGFGGTMKLEKMNMMNIVTSNQELAESRLGEIIYSTNLVTINSSTFKDCYNLVKLTLLSTTPPSLANVNAFSSVPYSCIIYVRKNTATLYAVATNWSTIYTQYQFVELNY